MNRMGAYLRERSVVPEVTFVGKAIAHVAKLALLDILLDRIQLLLLRDLGAAHQSQLR